MYIQINEGRLHIINELYVLLFFFLFSFLLSVQFFSGIECFDYVLSVSHKIKPELTKRAKREARRR